MAKVLTPHFVASFPNLFQAASYMESEPKYSVTAIFHPEKFNAREKELWKKMQKAIDEVCLNTFKKKATMLPKNFKLGLRDGSEKPELNGFTEDCIFANLTSKFKPGIIDLHDSIVEEEEERVYAGCIMRATITPYAYNNVGKGYALGLNNVQLLKWDTPRLDGRTSASEDFGSESSEYDDLESKYESDVANVQEKASSGDDFDDDIPF